MKIISPSYEILPKPKGDDILKHIERCGRICYKSEGLITENSAAGFVGRIIKRGHEAVLEHGSFCFSTDPSSWRQLKSLIGELENKGFCSYLRFTDDSRPLVSGNIRAWRDFMKSCMKEGYKIPGYMKMFVNENSILFPEYQDAWNFAPGPFGEFCVVDTDDLLTDNERLTHRDMTILFTVDRGVSHEIVRHRPASYCQESTRYCNYSKDEFGKEITVIKPNFLLPFSEAWRVWEKSCLDDEAAYFGMLDLGCTPQHARDVLPTSTKTEIVMTTNLREWRHFFKLRCSSAAHPQIREVATPALNEVAERTPDLCCDILNEVLT